MMKTIWNFRPALILHNSNTHLLILLNVLNRVIQHHMPPQKSHDTEMLPNPHAIKASTPTYQGKPFEISCLTGCDKKVLSFTGYDKKGLSFGLLENQNISPVVHLADEGHN